MASVPISWVDPLAVFRSASEEHRQYWERPDDGVSVVGVGRALRHTSGAFESITSSARGIRTATVTEAKPTAFVAIPFDARSAVPASLTIPEVAIQSSAGRSTLTVSKLADVESDLEAVVFGAGRLLDISREPFSNAATVAPLSAEAPERKTWDELVKQALSEVERGHLSKVVIARREVIRYRRSPDPGVALDRLRQAYPSAAVFAVGDGDSVFFGASPERLVRVEGGKVSVDCLAGTAARGATTETDRAISDDLLRDDKNRREHAAVVEFVAGSLEPYCRDLDVDVTPSIRTLPNLHHLATGVQGSLREKYGILDVAKALHPTPAMAGVPRKQAVEFIHRHEGFDRGLYSGGIGWTDLEGNGEVTVAIRSALLEADTATLYAGNGIVAGSDPASEWDETELKLAPVRSALNLS